MTTIKQLNYLSLMVAWSNNEQSILQFYTIYWTSEPDTAVKDVKHNHKSKHNGLEYIYSGL